MTWTRTLSMNGRLLVLLSALATALALVALPAAAPADAQEDDGVQPARVSGETRYETAADIARLTFPDGAQDAILVTGEDYPDALAASFVAGAQSAPILLTPQASVTGAVWQALQDLEVERVIILGGEAAVSATAEAQLDDGGYDTLRIAGANRFATAADAASNFGGLGVGQVDGDRTALLASGEEDRFADALAAGPIAAEASLPLLLTPTGQAVDVVAEALEELDIERIIVVGGSAAVSADVVTYYADRGYEMERWAGATRTDTATVVAQNAYERFDAFDPSLILLARGDDYPDALAAIIHGAVTGSAILLTANPTVLSPSTEGYLFDLCPQVDAIRALGGTGAVSEQALSEAVSAADQCRDGVPEEGDAQQSYIVSPQEFIEDAELGHEQRFELSGDADSLAGATEMALFPCEDVNLQGGQVWFTDSDGDGFADGVGSSDTGAAWISQIQGVSQSEDQTRDRAVQPEPGYSWHIQSNAPDCTIPVVWEGGPHDAELPVDGDGAPTVRFGVGAISWSG
jgi:putative cell wall-binding protein